MRKSIIQFITLIFISLIIINCTREGPEGPAGAAGPQGPAGNPGAPGATGTANVIYSSWFNLLNWHDSTMTDQGLSKIDYKDAPGITASVLSSGVVLSYITPSVSSNIVYALPWTLTSITPNVVIGYRSTPGRLIYYNNRINMAGGIGVSPIYSFRYVIIPGGVAGGRGNNEKIVELKGQTYSETQLKNMPYRQVCDLLNIQP
jgi:hypothetical protein